VGGLSQVWQVAFENVPTTWPNFPNPVQISGLAINVDNMMVSPTYDTIAFSAQVYPNMSIPETVTHDAERAASGGNFKSFNKLYIRHWDTWVEKRNQIFVASLSFVAGQAKFGQFINIVNLDSDAPTRPFGDSSEWSYSPDGKKFAFCRQHDEYRNVSWNTNDDIFVVEFTQMAPVPVATPPENLTPDNPARDSLPRFSPNGTKLAYVSMSIPGYESDRNRVKLYDVSERTTTTLTEAWNYSVDSVTWSYNSSYLVGIVLQDGELTLQKVPLDPTMEGEPLVTNGNVASPVQTPFGEWVFGYSTWQWANELFVTEAKIAHAPIFTLTKITVPILAKCQTMPTEKFEFMGANNETVKGWITKPVGFQSTKTYPVAFLIHGGPQSAWEQSWSWRWNPQIYAGRGYGVVMVNFHGSSGYGQNFTDSIVGNYGSLPFEDLMKGLDYALANNAWMDRNRVAALGASYGGYMIYWIAGQSADYWRFKCLVAHDGMFDIRTFYYTTEELFFPEHDLQGTPFLNPDNYERYNPINHVANWSLPMLVIHGGMDYRITDSQGIAAFTALQRLGIPSQFLYFPTENHWVLNPINQLTWHNHVLNFIDNCTM